MKRKLLFLAPLVLAACSNGGNMNVDVTSDDLGENAQGVVSAFGTDLTTVKAVNVTVDEIWAHVDDKEAKEDSITGESISDDGDKWQLISDEDRTIDLMTVRNNATRPLGELELPAGKITQIRLKLKAGEAVGDHFRVVGAVTEADGTVCDLRLPKSAINPGVKISGVFKAMKIEAGGKYRAVINLKLKESEKLADGTTCAYKLNPVLKVKKYEIESGAEATVDDKK
jgi:hypothetical protein